MTVAKVWNGSQWVPVAQGSQGPAGPGGGGMAPFWVAANDAPAALKASVNSGGGLVCDGTDDQADILSALSTYKSVALTEGNFAINDTVTVPQGKRLHGSGARATMLVGAAGLSGGAPFLFVDDEWAAIDNLGIDGGASSAAPGIQAAVTSNAGFTTGSEANLVFHNIMMRNVGGIGLEMSGTYNRDSKISHIHIWNCGGSGVDISCPDGSINQLIVGSAGLHGLYAHGASNWRLQNVKTWYSDGDGFWLAGERFDLANCEAQDNLWAGFRITGNFHDFTSCKADSNSWDTGAANANLYSGFEVGRTQAGGTAGGFDINFAGCQAWDKNEGSRGYSQRSGWRMRSGTRRLSIVGCGTGNSAGSLHNVSNGLEWDTAGDATHASNAILMNNHGTVSANP